MAAEDRTFAWWNGLRHQGLLISPALLPEFFPGGGHSLTPFEYERVRDRYTSFLAHSVDGESGAPLPAEAGPPGRCPGSPAAHGRAAPAAPRSGGRRRQAPAPRLG